MGSSGLQKQHSPAVSDDLPLALEGDWGSYKANGESRSPSELISSVADAEKHLLIPLLDTNETGGDKEL